MFKNPNCEDELLDAMTAKLSLASHSLSLQKIKRAYNYLTEASEILNKSGFKKEAEEVLEVFNKFAQAIMPEYTQVSSGKIYPTTDKEIKTDENGRKYYINYNLVPVYLDEKKSKNTNQVKNKYNLSPNDVERVQLSLNKIIKDYSGNKPSALIPDQKWGPLTENAFNWYNKNTFNAPLQALKALLDHTQKSETVSG